ncbi:hypothetical protein CAPTEDRAFT_190783 [Capitella teleta]|uniref:Uncharacterized protein n=1 Tax=Capitella teleta TaxID=283909 RepID=R7UI23_CAPTE|nr:hypothetical protein CAPTEDRAFT_190783 [Capitella teleta]|eukprot:ELU06204.1 hypothetical protein CAPTEDRAFT_190783 [Capitella teleta]
MASQQKVKKKKQRSKTPSITPKEEESLSPAKRPITDETQRSLISVREADKKARQDNLRENAENVPPQNGEADSPPSAKSLTKEGRSDVSRPPSGRSLAIEGPSEASRPSSRPLSAAVTSHHNGSRPQSAVSKRSNVVEPLNSNIGSKASLRSKEAWSEDILEQRPTTSQSVEQLIEVQGGEDYLLFFS